VWRERAAASAYVGRFAVAERLAERFASQDPEGSRWLRAYVAAARGDFQAAERLAEPLARGARDVGIRVSASLTLGSVLRQTGRHRRARAHDLRAARLATTSSARAHALIGLAADAVGVGDAGTCAGRLAEAAGVVPRGDWRARVRLDWVRAEHALLVNRPRAAARAAARALSRSRAAGARRHEAKSSLFLGAALATAGDDGARRPLRDAERLAARLGAVPIARVARELLDGLPVRGR